MAKKTSIKGISNEIAKILSEYSSEVEEGLDNAKDRIAKDTAKKLKKTSPEKTGDYRKGWRVSNIDGRRVIHNKTDYQLTHLLENGHVNRDGSRTAPRVHIRPAEEQAIEEFIEETKKVIQRK